MAEEQAQPGDEQGDELRSFAWVFSDLDDGGES